MGHHDDLDQQLDRLEHKLPRLFSRAVAWLRKPSSRVARIPLALLLFVGGFAGFLPVLGFWMLPLGLALIALDIPPLRPPMARFLAWVNGEHDRTRLLVCGALVVLVLVGIGLGVATCHRGDASTV